MLSTNHEHTMVFCYELRPWCSTKNVSSSPQSHHSSMIQAHVAEKNDPALESRKVIIPLPVGVAGKIAGIVVLVALEHSIASYCSNQLRFSTAIVNILI